MPKQINAADEKGGITHPDTRLADYAEDKANELTLRPQKLSDFIGQVQNKRNLEVYIKAARERGESLDHLFLTGPPGLGKTTVAHIIANELSVEFRETSAPALDKAKDLIGILTNLKENSVFFIDEIHRLKPAIEEMLYIAMEDYALDWIIGQGPGAREVRIPLKPFTLVGATTKAGMVAPPLISRFGIPVRFSFYENDEMETIVRRSARILKVDVTDDAAKLIAASARGTPRIANRLLRRMRDFAQVNNQGIIDSAVVKHGLTELEIDSMGLESFDREILRLIIGRYGGGPVGAETLAISVGESCDTLEDYYEPFLIQSGLLQRTPRGRVVTELAYKHLNIRPAHGNRDLSF